VRHTLYFYFVGCTLYMCIFFSNTPQHIKKTILPSYVGPTRQLFPSPHVWTCPEAQDLFVRRSWRAHQNPSSHLATLAFISKSLPNAPPDPREVRAANKAALASALTAPPPVVRSLPRFLLPRASGAAGLQLPTLPSPSSYSPDLLLGGGILTKFDG
jgi:hypothetical protein